MGQANHFHRVTIFHAHRVASLILYVATRPLCGTDTMRGQWKRTAIFALGGAWLAVSILAVAVGVRAEERDLESESDN